jgi:hypothetical protein
MKCPVLACDIVCVNEILIDIMNCASANFGSRHLSRISMSTVIAVA